MELVGCANGDIIGDGSGESQGSSGVWEGAVGGEP